jgi:hypothetical protein
MAHHGLKRGAPAVETGVVHIPLKVVQAEKRERLQNAAALKEMLRQPFDKLLGKEASIANMIEWFLADMESDSLAHQEKKRTAALLKKQQEELAKKDHIARALADENVILEMEVERLRALLDDKSGSDGDAPPINGHKPPAERPQPGMEM